MTQKKHCADHRESAADQTPESFIFLLGSERSGSNLITRIFDAHEAICGPPPTHLGSDMLANLHRYEASESGKAEFLADFQALFEAKMDPWVSTVQESALSAFFHQATPLELYLHRYRIEARARNKPVVFIKENRLYEWAALLAPVLTNCRFVYLVRDPRDMALSWKKAPALRGGVLRAANVWRRDQMGFGKLRAQLEMISGQPVPALRYESLIREPETVMKVVCEDLSLKFDPAMMAFHATENARSGSEAVAEWSNLNRPLMAGNAGKYRDGLSADEVRYIEALCAEPMAALGYQADHEPCGSQALNELEVHLAQQEPWDKPAYAERPAEEQEKRRRQHAVFTRIRQRPWRTPVR